MCVKSQFCLKCMVFCLASKEIWLVHSIFSKRVIILQQNDIKATLTLSFDFMPNAPSGCGQGEQSITECDCVEKKVMPHPKG